MERLEQLSRFRDWGGGGPARWLLAEAWHEVAEAFNLRDCGGDRLNVLGPLDRAPKSGK